MDNFQYYLFDWDGCLADSLSLWLGVYHDIYLNYGIAATTEDIVAKSWGNLELGPYNMGISDNRKVWNEIVQQVTEKMKTVGLFPGAKEILQKLHGKGKKIAVVTSSNLNIVQPAISFHKLQPEIDLLVTGNDVTRPKPDPEVIYIALKNLEPEKFTKDPAGIKQKSVIIGDSDKDILAGKAAGIKTALVLHRANKFFYDFKELKKTYPDYIIKEFSEIF